MVNVMSKVITGKFSTVAGSNVRRYFDEEGSFVGLITKLESGEGYRVTRFPDRKERIKKTLQEAKRSLSRAN